MQKIVIIIIDQRKNVCVCLYKLVVPATVEWTFWWHNFWRVITNDQMILHTTNYSYVVYNQLQTCCLSVVLWSLRM